MSSGHAQTLGAFFFRGRRSKYQAKKYVVSLDDGDQLVIHDDQPESWITGDRIVILVGPRRKRRLVAGSSYKARPGGLVGKAAIDPKGL